MMSAGGRDLERALGALLALDVAQVERAGRGFVHFWRGPRQHLRPAEMVGDLNERLRGHDLDVRARPGGFGAAGGRADQTFLARIGPDRGGQYARDRRDRTVEPKLAEHGEA